MFRKNISPKMTAVIVVVLLATIQIVYWRLLVYQEIKEAPPGPGGGGGVPTTPASVGRGDLEVRTLTGDGPGYLDGGLWEARFCGPNALVTAPDGSMLVADSRNHRIRRIVLGGAVTTVAGGGEVGGAGGSADGAAAEARFRFPSGVAAAPDGTIYIADTGNHRICRLRDGRVETLAGGAEGKRDGSGSQAAFKLPAALTLDAQGALWVVDTGNHAVRRVDPSGAVSSPPAVPPAVTAILGDAAVSPAQPPITASEGGAGGPAITNFKLGRRSPGVPLGADAMLYADTLHRVLMLHRRAEQPFLLAGRRSEEPGEPFASDGAGNQASFALPCSVTVGPDGAAYIADYEASAIRQVLLPDWLREGAPVRENRPRGRWRMRRGS
jgi:hypothetical protein